MTTAYDNNGRNYLYVAGRTQGLLVYDMTDINTPVYSNTIPITSLDSQYVMNLTQQGNYLFLAMGDHWDTAGTRASLAIIDVTNPATPVIEDIWHSTDTVNGAGIVRVQGNFAYLGAMQQGLFVLDVTLKNDIQFASQLIPNKTWPDASGGVTKMNARGMAINNDILYLAYDNGGIRIINISNPYAPVETGRYANVALMGKPRAYNNVVLNDTLLYVAHDYCGMEILNVKDTSNIQLLSWYNPWQCDVHYTLFDWWGNDAHLNEVVYDAGCKTVFFSAGQTEILAINVADPYNPDSCEMFGTLTNNMGTWGISAYQDKLFASYIYCVIPFSSNFSGIKMVEWDQNCSIGLHEQETYNGYKVYPNPTRNYCTVRSDKEFTGNLRWELRTITGELVNSKTEFIVGKECKVDLNGLNTGTYILHLHTEAQNMYLRVIVE
jgi:hypothetical protein